MIDRQRVIIMNTDLAAFGINLTAADTIFFLEPVLNSEVERQAIARAHRLGQTRPVLVEKIVIESSIEEHVMNLSIEQSLNNSKQEVRKTHLLLKAVDFLPSSFSEYPEQDIARRSGGFARFAKWFEETLVHNKKSALKRKKKKILKSPKKQRKEEVPSEPPLKSQVPVEAEPVAVDEIEDSNPKRVRFVAVEEN